MSFSNSFFRLATATCCVAALSLAAGINMPSGKVELKSAGALAMGPDGILFVADTKGAAVVALATGDTTPATGTGASSARLVR